MDATDTINSTKESKNIKKKKIAGKIRQSISKNKKLYIGAAIAILLLPLVYGFISGIIEGIQIRKAHQGEMIFYVVAKSDIKDKKLLEWIDQNYKEKGIHVYHKRRIFSWDKDKYILLATGEQQLKDIEIKPESVVGYKDKIVVNGRVEPPKTNIERGTTYPHLLLRIDGKNDPREVHLGTMNLYDVFRGVPEPIRITLDTAIIKEINGSTIKLATFRKQNNYPAYTISDKAQNDIKEQGIETGDLVSVKVSNDLKEGYPQVENIRKMKGVVEKINVSKILEDEKLVNVHVNQIPFTFRYAGEIEDKIRKIKLNSPYLARLEKVGDVIYIKDIIGQ